MAIIYGKLQPPEYNESGQVSYDDTVYLETDAKAVYYEAQTSQSPTPEKITLEHALNCIIGKIKTLVPNTRKINSKALSADITLTPADVSAVATANIVNDLTTTVAGKVLDARQGPALLSAIQSLGSEVAQLEGVITPELFGAKGDGITDDTDALQTAIDVASGFSDINLVPSDVNISTGYIQSNGTLLVTGDWKTLNYIPVSSNAKYRVDNGGHYIAIYDENFTLKRTVKYFESHKLLLIKEDEAYVSISYIAAGSVPEVHAILDSKPLFLGNAIYRITNTLIINNPVEINGASVKGSILYLDVDDYLDEEIDEDSVNFKGSHAALSIRTDFCSFKNFAIYGYNPSAYAPTRGNACNWYGISMHYVNSNSYVITQRHSFDRLQINGFDYGVFIYGGWNRYFINCEITNCTTAGIGYVPLASAIHWSSSGDTILACQFIGCGIGVSLDKTFETILQNCVFEYNYRAVYARGCVNTVLFACWNEANTEKLLIIGNIKFIGGYNIDFHTIEHSLGYISLEKASETLGIRNGEIVFHQKDGVIVKGISIGSDSINLIPNASFGTIATTSLDGWITSSPYAVIVDDTNKLENANSIKIDTPDVGYDTWHTFHTATPIVLMPNMQYKLSAWVMKGTAPDLTDGAGFQIHIVNSENQTLDYIDIDGQLSFEADNVWTKKEYFFNSGNVKLIKFSTYIKRGGCIWINRPTLALADISSDRVELRETEITGTINVVNSSGVTIGTMAITPADSGNGGE